MYGMWSRAYGFVLLIEIIYISVQDFDEEFYRDGGVHACVCYSEGSLEAFEDSFSVTVELCFILAHPVTLIKRYWNLHS